MKPWAKEKERKPNTATESRGVLRKKSLRFETKGEVLFGLKAFGLKEQRMFHLFIYFYLSIRKKKEIFFFHLRDKING